MAWRLLDDGSFEHWPSGDLPEVVEVMVTPRINDVIREEGGDHVVMVAVTRFLSVPYPRFETRITHRDGVSGDCVFTTSVIERAVDLHLRQVERDYPGYESVILHPAAREIARAIRATPVDGTLELARLSSELERLQGRR